MVFFYQQSLRKQHRCKTPPKVPTLIISFQQIKKIEDEIELGQIEEVIEMAKDELVLIDYYYGTTVLD